jgi:hypothetical protein
MSPTIKAILSLFVLIFYATASVRKQDGPYVLNRWRVLEALFLAIICLLALSFTGLTSLPTRSVSILQWEFGALELGFISLCLAGISKAKSRLDFRAAVGIFIIYFTHELLIFLALKEAIGLLLFSRINDKEKSLERVLGPINALISGFVFLGLAVASGIIYKTNGSPLVMKGDLEGIFSSYHAVTPQFVLVFVGMIVTSILKVLLVQFDKSLSPRRMCILLGMELLFWGRFLPLKIFSENIIMWNSAIIILGMALLFSLLVNLRSVEKKIELNFFAAILTLASIFGISIRNDLLSSLCLPLIIVPGIWILTEKMKDRPIAKSLKVGLTFFIFLFGILIPFSPATSPYIRFFFEEINSAPAPAILLGCVGFFVSFLLLSLAARIREKRHHL